MKEFNIQNTIIENGKSIQAAAYESVQVNIDFANVDQKVRVIAVTSAVQNEGKSTTACNLAKMYALKGNKTVVIDLDLRKPTVYRAFGVVNDDGISEYCSGKIDLNKMIKKDASLDTLDVITAGMKTSFPNSILESEKVKDLIAKLREMYDYIIIDTTPILVVSDALVVSKYVDGMINVVATGKTKKSDLKEAMKIFRQNNVNIIGIVMTKSKISRRGYESYHYYK